MNVKKFIDRPVLSAVISVLIVILGIVGLNSLAVEQFPEIAPPTISVNASYTGANASTLQKSVIVPLEEAINGVENMIYMTSSASNTGKATITVYFKQGTDADMAAVNVQNRISTATGLLPAEVVRSGVSVKKRQASNIKILGIYSKDSTYSGDFLSNYFKINIEPQLSRIPGVGEVNTLGPDYALRIWLDPAKMVQYKLIPSDINAALSEQNLEFPSGVLGANSESTFQYALKYVGRYEDEKDYENIVIRHRSDGSVLRLKDVAKIELGAISYDQKGEINGNIGYISMISQTSGSNANEIIKEIDKKIEEIKETLPFGVEIVDIMSSKHFLDASIRNVIITLIQAILLVILVVYLFLQNFRSTLIPALAILVSLIGAFGVIYAIGFSLNMLTLFALVLVIGTVVDDAIVVVEAVQTKFDEGIESPYKATVEAMKGIVSPLFTTTIVFMAVFVPVAFIGGTAGTFYTQFGITMAVAVSISTLNALTLSPALCALLMTPHQEFSSESTGKKMSFSSRFHFAFEAAFKRIVAKYKYIVLQFLKRKILVFAIVLLSIGGLVYLFSNTKTALVPGEDLGNIFVNIVTAPGSSLDETSRIVEQVALSLEGMQQVEISTNLVGFSMIAGNGATNGMVILKLKHWDERTKRTDGVRSLIGQIYGRTAHITSASIMAFAPPMIPGYGANSGFELHIQDRKGGTIDELYAVTQNFIAALNKKPEVARAYTTFNARFPQYEMEVDVDLCKRNSVSVTDVLNTVSAYVGGSYSSNMNKFSKLYRVVLQADPKDRIDFNSFNNIFVRSSSGDMSPIAQYLKFTKIYGSESLSRFNMFTSISVNGTPAEGYSSGQVLNVIEELAEEVLPLGYAYEFSGMSREEASTGNSTIIVYLMCLLFVYLILCALYESLLIPFAVLLSIPVGLLGSFFFANILGLSNNIYMQTGVIMLIGLLAKTAILLTEYASARRKEGHSIAWSAMDAAKVRFRPILMTSLTMIVGMLPLVFASGVGANGNITLGVTIVGGMVLGTLALLLLVPTLFIIFQSLQEKIMGGINKSNIK